MQPSTSGIVLAKTDWAKVALIHLGFPAGLLLLALLFSHRSLEFIFSAENLLTETRWRTPYIFIPFTGLIAGFFVAVPLIFALRGGKMIWTERGQLRASYFQSIPLDEIEGSSLRLLDDKVGSELIFVLRSGGERSINLVYAKYDRTKLIHRLRELVINAQQATV